MGIHKKKRKKTTSRKHGSDDICTTAVMATLPLTVNEHEKEPPQALAAADGTAKKTKCKNKNDGTLVLNASMDTLSIITIITITNSYNTNVCQYFSRLPTQKDDNQPATQDLQPFTRNISLDVGTFRYVPKSPRYKQPIQAVLKTSTNSITRYRNPTEPAQLKPFVRPTILPPFGIYLQHHPIPPSQREVH